MTEQTTLSLGTAEIIGEQIEISISTTRATVTYVYSLRDLETLVYYPQEKLLIIKTWKGIAKHFDNVVSIETGWHTI